MSDLIERQAVIDWLKYKWNCSADSLFYGIQGLPPAHPKSGQWIFGHTLGHSWMKCSECLVSQDGQTACFNYCPNCGAKMEEDNTNG